MRDVFEEQQLDRKSTVRNVVVVVLALVLFTIIRPASAANLLGVLGGLVVFIVIHEFGHFAAAKWAGMKVTEFFAGFGPRIWSFRRGETEYGFKVLPLGGYVKIIGMNNLEEVDPADEDRTYRSKSFHARFIVAFAGPFMNVLLAFGLLVVVYAGFGVAEATTAINVVGEGTPAAAVGLQPGDTILSIDGRAVEEWSDVPDIVQPLAGQAITVVYQRPGEDPRSVTVTPEDVEGVGRLGISPQGRYERLGPIDSLTTSVSDVWRQTTGTISAFGGFFGNLDGYVQGLFTDDEQVQTDADENRFVSVVGLYDLGGDAARDGLRSVLIVMAIINLALAIFNLLPLPPFDGGLIAIASYEKVASTIRRRRVQVDMNKIMPLAGAVLVMVAFIAITSIYLDLVRGQQNPF